MGQTMQATAVDWTSLLEEIPVEPPLTPEEEEELAPIPDDAPEIPDFMVGHQLLYISNLDAPGYNSYRTIKEVDTPAEANIITSKVKGTKRHRPVLDIDFPAALIPSTTEGHYHLYLDKELKEADMDKLVRVLYEVGILAKGNFDQWFSYRQELALRLPWIKKKTDSPKDEALD